MLTSEKGRAIILLYWFRLWNAKFSPLGRKMYAILVWARKSTAAHSRFGSTARTGPSITRTTSGKTARTKRPITRTASGSSTAEEPFRTYKLPNGIWNMPHCIFAGCF